MSNGFANSTTRGMGKFEREVESRMKRLDVFTDDFSPPELRKLRPDKTHKRQIIIIKTNIPMKHTPI